MTEEEKLHQQVIEILKQIATKTHKRPDALWFAENGGWATHLEYAKSLFKDTWLWAFDERLSEFIWWYFDKQGLGAVEIYKLYIEYATEKHLRE